MNKLQLYIDSIINWKSKLQKDEWFFSRVNDLIINGMTSDEAFQFIPQLLDYVLMEKEEFVRTQALLLLLSVIRVSDTTEKPLRIEYKLNLLQTKYHNADNK